MKPRARRKESFVAKDKKAENEPKFQISYSRSVTGTSPLFTLDDLRELVHEADRRGFPPESRVRLMSIPSYHGWTEDTIHIYPPDERDAASERE